MTVLLLREDDSQGDDYRNSSTNPIQPADAVSIRVAGVTVPVARPMPSSASLPRPLPLAESQPPAAPFAVTWSWETRDGALPAAPHGAYELLLVPNGYDNTRNSPPVTGVRVVYTSTDTDTGTGPGTSGGTSGGSTNTQVSTTVAVAGAVASPQFQHPTAVQVRWPRHTEICCARLVINDDEDHPRNPSAGGAATAQETGSATSRLCGKAFSSRDALRAHIQECGHLAGSTPTSTTVVVATVSLAANDHGHFHRVDERPAYDDNDDDETVWWTYKRANRTWRAVARPF